MKQKWFTITTISVIILVIAFLFNPFQQSEQKIALKQAAKAAIGTTENPQARWDYEWQRLKSPLTGDIPENIRKRELNYAAKLPVRAEELRLAKKDPSEKALQTNVWTQRGPYNVGGRTRAMILDADDENIIIAGGVSGGMWRSTDGGANWTKTSEPDQLHSITCLVQDTRAGKTNIMYCGTGEYRGNSASANGASFRGDGIFKSTNGGQSWSLLPATSTGNPHLFDNFFDYVWNLAIDPSNTSQDEVYAATYGRIYRSTNGGTDWNYEITTEYSAYTDVAVTSQGVVYATLDSDGGASAGIYRSEDGQNWVKITPANWPSTYRRVVIGIAPSNENVVYFLANTPGEGQNDHNFWKYTYVSGDGSGNGGTWVDRTMSLPAEGGKTGDFVSQGSYDLVISVKPDDENVVFIGGINLYRSDDGFATNTNTKWIGGYTSSNDSYADYENHHPDQHALFFYPSNSNKLLSGHDGGISLTTNCMADMVSWTMLNNGYNTTQFYTGAINHFGEDDNLLIGGMQDNGTWMVKNSSAGADWTKLLGGDGAYCAVSNDGAYYYTSSQNGTTYRLKASDPIYDWARIDPQGGSDYLFINPFILDANDSKIMYMTAGPVIWRNSDVTQIPKYNSEPTSQNWTKLTNTQVPSGVISALSTSTVPANVLYYGTSDGRVYRVDNANSGDPSKTDISGANFPASGGYVSCVAVNPSNADKVMVTFSNYEVVSIFYSSDGGGNWQNVSGNLEENQDGTGNGPSVRWADIIPVLDNPVYFVATSTGLYSTDQLNGTSTIWMQEGPSTIGNVVVDMIKARTTDNKVMIATHGNGIYTTTVSTAIEDEEGPFNVSGFELKQNYPNPFNPSTTIPYQLNKGGAVKLSIYNSAGERVVTLVRQHQNAGSYEVTWNGKDYLGNSVASGVYFYRLSTENQQKSRQMVFLK